MFTCEQIWNAIDLLALRQGVSVSRLSIMAGLDATALNVTKRSTEGGKLRWISTGTIAKILAATDTAPHDFFDMVCGDRAHFRRQRTTGGRWVGGRAQILVVDGDTEFGARTGEELGRAGYNVETVPDLRRALAIIESPQRLDMLIANLELPHGIHGRSLARIALMYRPELKCVFVAASLPADPAEHEKETVLQKPVAAGRLVSIAERLFAPDSPTA